MNNKPIEAGRGPRFIQGDAQQRDCFVIGKAPHDGYGPGIPHVPLLTRSGADRVEGILILWAAPNCRLAALKTTGLLDIWAVAPPCALVEPHLEHASIALVGAVFVDVGDVRRQEHRAAFTATWRLAIEACQKKRRDGFVLGAEVQRADQVSGRLQPGCVLSGLELLLSRQRPAMSGFGLGMKLHTMTLHDTQEGTVGSYRLFFR